MFARPCRGRRGEDAARVPGGFVFFQGVARPEGVVVVIVVNVVSSTRGFLSDFQQ